LDLSKEEIIIVVEGVKGDAVNSDLEIGWCEPDGKPRVVTNCERLVEF